MYKSNIYCFLSIAALIMSKFTRTEIQVYEQNACSKLLEFEAAYYQIANLKSNSRNQKKKAFSWKKADLPAVL